MVDRMSELFGYPNSDNLVPKKGNNTDKTNNPTIKSIGNGYRINVSTVNNSGVSAKELSKSDKAKIEGKIERYKYRNYYDVNGTITTAQATDPHDEDHPNYNRERIFEALERNAERLIITNDGVDTLWIIVSHQGGQNFARERPLYPGDIKEFYNVYELRLRSPTAGVEYRVSEYDIDIGCCPKPGVGYTTAVSQGNIPGAMHGSKVGVNSTIPSSTYILLSNVTSVTNPTNFPATAQQMQIVSTNNANDIPAGTGAQQVKLTYLRSPASVHGFTENTEYILMNGTTPVLTVNTDIYRIEKLEVSRVGTSLFAIGDISIQSVGGATTYEKIDAGTNVSRTAVHYVQKGMMSTLYEATLGASTAGGTLFIIEQTFEYQTGNAVTHGVDQIELTEFALDSNLTIPHVIKNPNNLIMFFAIVVKGRASNQSASGTLHFIDSTL